ncbi:MAG TPA: acyl carrier protein [Candidatus Angelobacter sp.]|nr:acyl carrier protein [Candidatus Angelobacter sp.]
MKNVQPQIVEIISQAAMVDRSRIRPEASFAELGVDSLAQIECVFLLEEAFQIEMREENLYGLRTVQDVIDAVNQSLAARPAQDLTVQ